mmetsp:Transcript_48241/g.112884  ORF Transcript_48241/g.112884 Transcript_48241/m.112884 type:complete len:475 (+) Transcript_48241:79-1503(+)
MARILAVSLLALGAEVSALNHISREANLESKTPFYKSECWKKRPVASLVQGARGEVSKEQVPFGGAISEPFVTVMKDGFYNVACVKDYMYSFGDKYGDGKFAYAVADLSNVSIVHYDTHVLKEDREPMTPTTCFEFCRTVPEMTFFGLTNGRTCYCTPYYQAMASDSTQCDVVCDGDNTQMCGGKTKSDIYEMHMCSDTQADLTKAVTDAEAMSVEMEALATNATEASKKMQSTAARMKLMFGQAGDPSASDLMVSAMQFAGELDHAAEAVLAVVDQIKSKVVQAGPLSIPLAHASSDSTLVAEAIIQALDSFLVSGASLTQELKKLYTQAVPVVEKAKSLEQYYPAMYFVDKEFDKVPATCTGDVVDKPIVGLDMEGCAYACNSNVEDCVGFSYFGAPTELCFLFSKLEKLQYYTGCGGDAPEFLQMQRKKAAPFESFCMAKFSKFDGTTLKPDPSHKSTVALEEATKADRCY